MNNLGLPANGLARPELFPTQWAEASMLADEELPGSSEQSRSPRHPRESHATASSPHHRPPHTNLNNTTLNMSLNMSMNPNSSIAAATRLAPQPPSPSITHRVPTGGMVGLSPQGSRELGRLATPPRGMRTTSGGSAVVLPAPSRQRMQQQRARPPTAQKHCNCKNSRCLKLYCECFASGRYCDNCNCLSCCNNSNHEAVRQAAVEAILERNPNAFRPKIQGTDLVQDPMTGNLVRHNKGCNCKKSGCLKKYCECFQANILCSDMCKCVDCKNFEGSGARAHIVGHRMGEQREPAANLHLGPPKRSRLPPSRTSGGEASTSTMSPIGGLANRGSVPMGSLQQPTSLRPTRSSIMRDSIGEMVKRGGLTEMGKLLLLIARERGEDTSTAAGAAPNGSASASQPSQSLQLLQQLPGDLPGEAVHADGVNGTHGSALDAKMESHEAGLQLADGQPAGPTAPGQHPPQGQPNGSGLSPADMPSQQGLGAAAAAPQLHRVFPGGSSGPTDPQRPTSAGGAGQLSVQEAAQEKAVLEEFSLVLKKLLTSVDRKAANAMLNANSQGQAQKARLPVQASPHQRSAVSSMYPAQGFPQGQLPSQLISHLQGQIQGQLQNRISPYAGQLQGGISLPMGTPADQQNLYASSALIQQAIIQASRMQASGGSPVFPQPAPQGSHQGSPALAPALSQAMRLQHSHMAAAAAAAGLPAAPGAAQPMASGMYGPPVQTPAGPAPGQLPYMPSHFPAPQAGEASRQALQLPLQLPAATSIPQGHAKDIQKAAEQLALATQVRDASAAQASGRGSVPPTTQPGFNTQPQIPGSGPGPVSQPALSYPAGPYNLPLPASLPGPSAAFPAAVSLQGHMPVPELPQAPVQAQLGAQAPSQQLFSGFPGQMSQQLLSFPMPGIPGPLTFTGPLPGGISAPFPVLPIPHAPEDGRGASTDPVEQL